MAVAFTTHATHGPPVALSGTGGTCRMHRLKLILGCLVMTAPLFAQSATSTIDIHGFGGWAYGKTDGHKYSLGTEEGEYDNAEFALNVSAKPIEKLSIVAQVRLE